MRQTLEHQNRNNHIRGCESDEEAAASKKRRDCTQLGNLQSIHQQQEGPSIHYVTPMKKGGGVPPKILVHRPQALNRKKSEIGKNSEL